MIYRKSIEAVYIPLYMKTPFFPALRPCLAPMGSRTQAAVRSLAQSTLLQIQERLGPALDPKLLQKPAEKEHSRQRIFSLTRTFWCWIWQVLQGNTSCREVVRQVQALFAVFTEAEVDEGTSAYCRARKKLADQLLQKAFEFSHRSAEKHAAPARLLQGRPLKMADGSGLRVADTSENRKAFPPSKNQYPKPSFPILKIVALFSAASGAIMAKAIGSFRQSELRLLMSLRQALQPNDIVGGDRHFGCFVLAAWLRNLSVDLIARLSSMRSVDFRKALQGLGPRDGLFLWRKPAKASPLLSPEPWAALPEQMTVRIIRTRIERTGFRTRELTVVTTLLDAQLYPAQEILSAYLKRWRLEMCLDDLKTTLGMELLHCRSPQLLEKELLIFLTAHNLLRWIMAQAAQLGEVELERISFKGTLDAFRQWTGALVQLRGARKKGKRARVWRQFLETLMADLVPLRPGRKEPRAVKKRSKYPPLNKPRCQYTDRWSRNKRRCVARAKKNASLK
jgi:hypothetical protein